MCSAAPTGVLTRGAVFYPLLAFAKARVVTLAEGRCCRTTTRGFFSVRWSISSRTESGSFGATATADPAFYAEVAAYLAARVGSLAGEVAVLGERGLRGSELLGLSHPGPLARSLDRAVLHLINHEGGHL